MEEAVVDIEMEIPCYFMCPISMQLMKDPVVVSTGITYDRESIERWLLSCQIATCPVTKQDLLNRDLIPNHTLRRLIQAWRALNQHERIPTPEATVDDGSLILKLLDDAKNSLKSRLSCLYSLRSIVHRNESGRRHLRAAGALEFVASVVRKNEDAVSRDEALNILQQMELSDADWKELLAANNGKFLESLMQVLKNGNCQSRSHAITLLKSAFYAADPIHLIESEPEFFSQITSVVADKISPQAAKTALKLLVELCPRARNRIKAVESGAVSVLVELLLGTGDRRACELALAVLDQLCGCAEGRAELLGHGAGLAIVSKKILRVSHGASERAVTVLSSISRRSPTARVVEEMLQVGVVSKLCLVLQVESSERTKERAREILRRHSRAWKGSSCIPTHLLSSYPSS